MKTTRPQSGHFWLTLAIQIIFFSFTYAQDPSGDQDLLVAPLPELLKSEEGLLIESSQQWEEIRRADILELFREHVYGRVPESNVSINPRLVFEDREALNGTAIMKEVVLEVCRDDDSLELNLLVFLPVDREGPVPLFVGLNFYGNQSIHPDPKITLTESWVSNNKDFGIIENRATTASRGVRASRWPVELILSRGYGLATMYYGDIDPDFDDGFKNGIHELMDIKEPGRDSASWGSISAWAWGLSRAMDYFERDVEIDQKRVALMGHSRLGKTSLWAGAQDERFALVISNNSGCGGAALSRRPYGERVSKINTVFPHWFAKRFHEYNDNEGALPVDQHMLMALVAPRPLYVASAQEDNWADQPGEYLSLVYGSEAYKLYDKNIHLDKKMPRVDQPVSSGKLGYHIRSGKHDVKRYDWEQYLDFADRHLVSAESRTFAYPVSKEWIEESLFASSPRLILTPQVEYTIWNKLDSDDTVIAMGLELLRHNAESMLEMEALTRIQTGRRLLGVSREAIRRLTTLALIYRLEREQPYLDRLEQELKAVCSFSDWNPSHFLDVGEMAAGVALALDWAGEWISPEVEQEARYALINKALRPGLLASNNNAWINAQHNWNLVCHGGLSLAALTVFEDEPELATAILRQAVEKIPLALKPYAPEGIYPEGSSYWFYATTYLSLTLSAFESALGTDFGFSDSPGVLESAVYSQVLAGPSGEYFDFFDSSLDGFHSLSHFGLLSWFARRSGSGMDWNVLAELLEKKLSEQDSEPGPRFYAAHFLNLALLAGGEKDEFIWPETWSGRGEEPVVILRDNENNTGAFFLAAKGGRAADNHGNMDAGSFVFEKDGVRWSVDPGNQSYHALEQVLGGALWNAAQDSRRWDLLTKNNFGHSVLTINGEKFLVDGRADLVQRDSRSLYPEYTFDLSALYGENLEKADRTFTRVSKSCLRITDRVSFSALTESLTWQMMTQAEVEVDGNLLILQQDGKTLYLRIEDHIPFEVKVVALSPPPLPYDKDMEGLKRLEIHWKRADFPGPSAVLIIELDSK
jgi:hypothetical protein